MHLFLAKPAISNPLASMLVYSIYRLHFAQRVRKNGMSSVGRWGMLQAANTSDRIRQLARAGRAAFIDINQYIVPNDLKLSLSPCMRWNMAPPRCLCPDRTDKLGGRGIGFARLGDGTCMATISRPVARAL